MKLFPTLNGKHQSTNSRCSFFHSCPNESVTFTCSGTNVTIIEWKVEPYTNVDGDLSYIPLRLMDDPGPQTRNSTDKTLLSELVYFSRISDRLANIYDNKSYSCNFRCG